MPNESAGKSSWWVINEDARIVRPSPRMRAASVQLKNAGRGTGHLARSASCSGTENPEDALVSLTGNQHCGDGLSSTMPWNESMSDNYWNGPERMYALSSPSHQRDHRSLKTKEASEIDRASWMSATLSRSDSKTDDDSVWMNEDDVNYRVKLSKRGAKANTPDKKLANCQANSNETVVKDVPSVSPGMAFIQSMRLRANFERKRHSSCMQSEYGRASRSIFDDYPRDNGAPSYMDSRSAGNVIPEDALETNESSDPSAGQSSSQEEHEQSAAQAEKPPNQFQYLQQLLENSPQSAQLVADRHAFIRLLIEKPHLKAKVQQLLADKYKQRTSEIAQQAQKKLHELQHQSASIRTSEESDSGSHQRQMATKLSLVKSEASGLTNPLPTNSNPVQAVLNAESTESDESEPKCEFECNSNSSFSDCWPTFSNGRGACAQSSSTASGSGGAAEELDYSTSSNDAEGDLLPSIDFDCDIDQVINYGNLFLNEYVDFESLKLHTSSSSEQSLCDFLENTSSGGC